MTAIKAFQKQSGLPETGTLESATLAKLGIGTSVNKVNAVADWRPVPTQEELDKMAANPANDLHRLSAERPSGESGSFLARRYWRL
ncbi:MAG: peptidoglycan-binding domain-containing protein [Methylocella sp.]